MGVWVGEILPCFKNFVSYINVNLFLQFLGFYIFICELCQMLTSLPNGKVVDLPLDVLFLSDENYALYIQALMAANAGDEIQDSFRDSSLGRVKSQTEDEIQNEEFPDDDLLLGRDDI